MKIRRALCITLIIIMASAEAACAGIVVTPDRHIVTLQPGESETVEYEIINSGEQDINIDIEPQDWSGIDVDIYTWVSLDKYKLTVGPGETKKIKVAITAPEGLEGEIVGMLFLCYKEDEASPLNIRNGIPAYLVMEGTEDYSLKVSDIEVGYIEEDRPVSGIKVIATIKNDGNIHSKPDIKVTINDKDGSLLRDFLLEEAGIILREKENAYSFFWRRKVLPDGDYTVTVEPSYQDKIKGVKVSRGFSIVDRKLIMP